MYPPRLPTAWALCLSLLLGACARGEEPPAAPPAPAPVVRVPVPPAEKHAAAETQLKDIYKAEYAKTDPASRAAFAKELLKQAPTMKDDPAALYVMLRDAHEFAASGRDLETGLAAAKMLGERFEVDSGELETASFTALSHQTIAPEDADKALALGLDEIEALEKDDRYECIDKLSVALDALARRGKSPALVSQAAEKLKDCRTRGLRWQQIKPHLARLKEKPDDAESNLAVGRYYAEAKKNFGKALPCLAKGKDEKLKDLAQKDLANPADLDGRLAVGDAWWEAGEREMGGLKPALRVRAAFWYEQIVDNLTGLKKAVIQKRIDLASTVALGAVRPLPITWKEGVIRTVRTTHVPVAFIPASRWGLFRNWVPGIPTTCQVCDLETGELVREVNAGMPVAVNAVSGDGRTAVLMGATTDKPYDYVFLDLRSGGLSTPKPSPFGYHNAPAAGFTPEGEAVAWGWKDGQFSVVRLKDGAPQTAPVKSPPRYANWFPERREVLVCTPKEAIFYDAKTGKEKRKIAVEPQTAVVGFQWGRPTPDGRLALFVGYHEIDDRYGILDLNTGKWLHLFPHSDDAMRPKYPRVWAFLPEGHRLAAVCMDGTFRVRDMVTWKDLYPPRQLRNNGPLARRTLCAVAAGRRQGSCARGPAEEPLARRGELNGSIQYTVDSIRRRAGPPRRTKNKAKGRRQDREDR